MILRRYAILDYTDTHIDEYKLAIEVRLDWQLGLGWQVGARPG